MATRATRQRRTAALHSGGRAKRVDRDENEWVAACGGIGVEDSGDDAPQWS